MTMRALLSAVCVSALTCGASAFAEPQLIAVGKLEATTADKAALPEAVLENGVSNHLFGGLGSGLDYAGNDTFLALPDRGPNASEYNAAIDNTTSFIPRFHTLKMSLKPNLETGVTGVKLPFVVDAELLNTQLFSSPTALIYGDGVAAGLKSGKPAINTKTLSYFTGRSDGFAAGRSSTDPAQARLDPESLRLSKDGKSLFVSDEYGPHLYQFDAKSGQRVKSLSLPANLAIAVQTPSEPTEVKANTRGRYTNKGMEGLAITPDGATLVGAMQAALIQDGGASGAYTRLISVDIKTGQTREYAYELGNIGSAEKPKYAGISEILAIDAHRFLVLERDSKGFGAESDAAFKRLYLIDLTDAQDISTVEGADNLAPKAVKKTLFLDMVSALTAKGIEAANIPAKLEGITFGPDITFGNKTWRTLWLASDNDFLPTTKAKSGEDALNPNRFYVFAFDNEDLK